MRVRHSKTVLYQEILKDELVDTIFYLFPILLYIFCFIICFIYLLLFNIGFRSIPLWTIIVVPALLDICVTLIYIILTIQ